MGKLYASPGGEPRLLLELEDGRTLTLTTPTLALVKRLDTALDSITCAYEVAAAILSCNLEGKRYTTADVRSMLPPSELIELFRACGVFLHQLRAQQHLRLPYYPGSGGDTGASYSVPSYWEHEVAHYANLSLPEVQELDYEDYLQLRRDAFISAMRETPSGREYLDNAARLTQTEPDRAALRTKYGKGA